METLDLLPEPERQLIESWQQGPVVEVPPPCVHQLFEQQVERTPEAIALVFGDQQITYSELNARSNQLAHRLIARGVGPNRVVALDAQRSIELTVAMLAILKAGGAYLPLDPAWPPQRRDQVLAEARPWLRIALDGLADDCQDPIPCANPASNPAPRATLDALAYVIFTSGSTGVPKGVAMPQRAFANLIRWHQQDERLARPARTLQFAAPGFDVSLQEIFSTLCCGGSLLIVADADRQDPQRLWRVIQAGTIERLFLPYVVLEQLAIAAQVASTPAAPSHLRDVVSAGEALKLTDAISRFLADRPACRLHNHYGPTETHVVCSHLLAFDPAGWPLAAPIGRPIAATNLQVVDRAGNPCPIGIAGELLIGGDGLASGYLNRPDLTAERFRFAPLLDGLSDFAATDRRAASTATATGACFYRSGDLVTWNPDGTLVYVGRLDQQIKLRGFRIEPGDIESHLLAHPAVAQAVVVLRQDHPNHPRLIAYWVRQKTIPTPTTSASTNRPTPTTPSKRDTEKLRSFFVERLPDPMVPSAFIELDALPLTSNGKLDRRALPAPSLSVAAEQRVKPSTNLELKLHALWAEVLGHGDFGIDDNFFQVGGHSLTAARLIAAIDDHLSIRLPIATIFHAPQIGLLAERLAQTTVFPEAIDPCFVPLEREGTSAPLFVIHGYAGDVFCYTDFALALSPTRPVYGLQARGIDGHAERHRDLQEMAEHYADLIDQHYPDGVVHLLGQSAGGWYAWAVASVLVRRGRLIGMMAILDSGPTAAISARLRASLLARRTARRLPTYLHLLRHNKRPRNLLAFLQERQRNLTAHLQRFRVPPAPLLQEEATAPGDRCEPPIDYFVGLCQRYRPQPQPLRVHLLTSRHDPRLTYHLWRAMACGGVVARQLFEEHHHFHTAAHADQLAAAIAEILEQVEAV